MPFAHSVSLIMPVFQEEGTIAQTLATLTSYLSQRSSEYEIIVVDDGSTDRTGKIADACARDDQHIKVIHNIRNQGSGRSLFTGLKAARFDLLVTNFADLPFDINELDKVESMLSESVDFIVVVRKDRSANTFYRKITSLVNYWSIRLLFGVPVSDFQFVQVFKRHVIAAMEIESSGTFVAPEMIIRAIRKGFVFKEFRTDFHPRRSGKAKCGSPKVILQTIFEMLKFFLKKQENGCCCSQVSEKI